MEVKLFDFFLCVFVPFQLSSEVKKLTLVSLSNLESRFYYGQVLYSKMSKIYRQRPRRLFLQCLSRENANYVVLIFKIATFKNRIKRKNFERPFFLCLNERISRLNNFFCRILRCLGRMISTIHHTILRVSQIGWSTPYDFRNFYE